MYTILPFLYFYFILLPNFCLNYQPIPSAAPAEEVIIRAMNYHGINFATCEPKGGREYWTFERDGKVCKLFTQAFIKKETQKWDRSQ